MDDRRYTIAAIQRGVYSFRFELDLGADTATRCVRHPDYGYCRYSFFRHVSDEELVKVVTFLIDPKAQAIIWTVEPEDERGLCVSSPTILRWLWTGQGDGYLPTLRQNTVAVDSYS